MRILLAAVFAACGLTIVPTPVQAQPLDCPPHCDRIPPSAWIVATSIPLYDAYRWPGLAALAATVTVPRFRFEDECVSLPVPADARAYAVASRAAVTSPDGQWHVQAQVLHWRGPAWQSGETALAAFDAGVAALRRCQQTAPLTSPSFTTAEPIRMAAVVSTPGRSVLHEYLLVDERNATISELAMWSAAEPAVAWPIVPDDDVLEAMAAPLCAAYLDSCR